MLATYSSIQVVLTGKLRMSHETHPFWKVRANFFPASIATVIVSAATVTTHHDRQNQSTRNAKVLCICHGKTFCIDCTQDSSYFCRKLTLSISTEWMATAHETLTSNYLEYHNRWIPDVKWITIQSTKGVQPDQIWSNLITT
jgi:hypothetical protein